MSTPESKLLSASEVATLLRLTQRRVNQLIKEGALKAEMVGSSNVIKTTSLAEYIENKRPKKSNGSNGHR